MKSIDTVSKKVTLRTPSQFRAAMAKSILLQRLKLLEFGHLTVSHGSEVYTYGQKRQESDLIARIDVMDMSAFPTILFGGSTGAAEAYMAQAWTSPNLASVIRIFVANQDVLRNMDSRWSWLTNRLVNLVDFLRLNTIKGSRKNIAAHYDLSNEFFSLFLDKTMMYSSAIYPREDASLEEASIVKLDHICKRLKLSEKDHLLEIGTGWGGLAIHAAKHYGCKVTTTTISKEQFALASERVQQEGLENKITLLMEDYRNLSGQYDKLVSIEMIEAVGHRFYSEFFQRCSRLLKSKGLMLIQAITTTDQRFEERKDCVDFIRQYIFPGGCLPSNAVILQNIATHTDMHLVGLDDITLDYARTLQDWRKRFFDKIDAVKQMGFDETFIRMWEYYLCYCEGGFVERAINTSQFLFAKPKCKELPLVV